MTIQSDDSARTADWRRRIDPIAVGLFLLGVLVFIRISKLNFLSQDANWDLLNYHAYVPMALLNGTWFSDFHPASLPNYLTPYQDLLQWPIISGLPAPIATAVLMAVQVSIFIPIGLILQVTVPGLSRSRALAVGLIGVSGAMLVTELGITMGDVPPAVLIAWALYLLASVLAGRTSRPERRAALAGVLVGAAVALKLTLMYTAPGLLAVTLILMVAGMRRSALVFLVVAPAAALLFYAPWAIVLQVQMGSPFFPLYNAVFHATRFPSVNYDTKFPITSLADLVALPVRQASGTAITSELQFWDARWLAAMLAVGLGLVVGAVRAIRPETRARWRGRLPALALLAFWCISYVMWAITFGIQRYAIVLEALAVPVIAIGASLAVPRLPSRAVSLLMLLALAGLLVGTTKGVDFGRRPMGWAPIVPEEAIEPLSGYDAIVIASPPLGHLRAITRNVPGSSDQAWLGTPFNDADLAVAEPILRGKSVAIIFFSFDLGSANLAANEYGLKMADQCTQFDTPMADSLGLRTVEVCAAYPLP